MKSNLALSHFCESIDYGYTESSTTEKIGPKFLRITDIVNKTIDWDSVPYCECSEKDFKKFQLHEGDIVIARTGNTTGESNYIENPPKSVFASYLIRLKINNTCDPLFIYYFLKSKNYVDHIYSIVGEKSAQKNANAKSLTEVKTNFPPKEIQIKISKTLHNLTKKIENLQNQNKIMEQIIQAIFKSWFVDFDDVKDFEKTKNDKIPKGWELIPFNEIAKCVKGFSYKGIEKFNEPRGFEFVTLNSIKEGGGFKKKFTWLESDRLKERHYVKEMDLIIANTEQTKDARLLTTPALVQFSHNYEKQLAVFSHHITKIETKSHNSKLYLYSFFQYYQKIIANAYHTGTGVWGFDHSAFENNYIILKPSLEVLEKFNEIVSKFHTKIIKNEKSISLLTITRKTTLPKLMSGEIQV